MLHMTEGKWDRPVITVGDVVKMSITIQCLGRGEADVGGTIYHVAAENYGANMITTK